MLPSEPLGLRTADVSKAKAVDLFSEFGELWLLDLNECAERFWILRVLEAFLSLGQGKFTRGVQWCNFLMAWELVTSSELKVI